MRRRAAGQTTTEFLMISGLITVIAIMLLRYVFVPPGHLACAGLPGAARTIQCTLQRIVHHIINEPG